MTQVYHDIDIFGDEEYNGAPKEYFDRDALRNSLTLWLMSKRGDFLDEPDAGGELDLNVFKNLTRENEEKLKFSLETALSVYFDGIVIVNNISIKQDRILRYTEVTVSYTDTLNGEQSKITVYPNNSTYKQTIKYTDIDVSGENLYNLVRLMKPDMLKQKLVFNIEENVWIWGSRFKFNNFDFSDPYFEEIIEYINIM